MRVRVDKSAVKLARVIIRKRVLNREECGAIMKCRDV
jgi:hypothetical protein